MTQACQDLLRFYLGITQGLLRKSLRTHCPQNSLMTLRVTQDTLYTQYTFLQWASSNLLAGGPLQGPTVDVPPSIAVTSTLLRVAGCSRKISGLLAHREGNGARFTNLRDDCIHPLPLQGGCEAKMAALAVYSAYPQHVPCMGVCQFF